VRHTQPAAGGVLEPGAGAEGGEGCRAL
jgi:hypothetical protein